MNSIYHANMIQIKSFRKTRLLWVFGLVVWLSVLLCASLPASDNFHGTKYNTTFHETFVKVAKNYEDVRETHGRNRSPQIDKWNRTARVPLGSSWCMSSLYSWYIETCKMLSVQPKLMRTASCSRQLQYAKRYGSGITVIPCRGLYGSVKVQVGDIFIQKRGGGSLADIGTLFLGHTGLCFAQEGTSISAIEGNTNKKGSREGDGVYIRTRKIHSLLALIRLKHE